MEVKKYIKKPVIIEAIQYTGNNKEEILDFIGFNNHSMKLNIGDYIIKNKDGKISSCYSDYFNNTYDLIDK